MGDPQGSVQKGGKGWVPERREGTHRPIITRGSVENVSTGQFLALVGGGEGALA